MFTVQNEKCKCFFVIFSAFSVISCCIFLFCVRERNDEATADFRGLWVYKFHNSLTRFVNKYFDG